MTFTINTTAPDVRSFYWANVGTTVASDFVENVNNGFLEAQNGTATLTLNVKNDTLTEGTETVRIALYHDEARTNLATLSGVVSVPDTSLTPLGPAILPNLYMWMDATDPNNTGVTPSNNTVLSTWVDKSGGSNSFVQNDATRNPTYSNSGIVFDNDDVFNYPSTNRASDYDFYVVTTPTISGFRSFSANNIAGIHTLLLNSSTLGTWNISNTGGGFSGFSNVTLTSTRILLGLRVASNGFPSVGINAPSTYAPHSVSNAAIGFRPTYFCGYAGFSQSWGTVNEFVQYNSNLSLTDRQKIEGYLAWKWDLVASLPSNHPYKTVQPTA